MSLLRALRECGAIDGLDQRFAEAVGRLGGVADERVLVAAALADRAPGAGHTRIALAGAAALLRAELGPDVAVPELPEPAGWWRAVVGATAIVRAPDEDRRTPLVAWDGAVYLDRYWDYEARLARAVRRRAEGPPIACDEGWLGRELELAFGDDPRVALQRAAAEAAVRRRLVLVTGGPGTGKTSVVVKLLGLLREEAGRAGRPAPRIVLAAPTGKAAARLGEAVGVPAMTLHRCLGLRPGRSTPRHHADAPLRADVVVVDEASMVDLPLMTKLFEAVRPDARLILLGDADQLESVEVGTVLADLCAAAASSRSSVPAGTPAPTTHPGLAHVALRHTWRYAADSGIGRLAEAIRAGDADAAMATLSSAADLEWIREPPDDPVARRQLLARLLRDGYPTLAGATEVPAALEAVRRFRVLCAHREGPYSVGDVHAVADALFGEGTGGASPPAIEFGEGTGGASPPAIEFGGSGPRAGLPVLVRSNDARLGVFNGDSGVLLPDPATGALRLFLSDGGPDGGRSVSPGLLSAWEPAFAATVHRSQGSEFDHVAVLLPPSASPLLTRALLYTAVTRARRRVTIVAGPEALARAVSSVATRSSGLRDQLLAAPVMMGA